MSISETSFRSYAQFLEDLEGLGEGATGAFIFEHDQGKRGVVFLERGTVCWAAVPGSRRELLDILMALSPSLDRAELVRTFNDARTAGQGLVSVLEALKLTPEVMEVALRQSTASALAHLANAAPLRHTFHSHAELDYGATFRFAMTDLLVTYGTTHSGNAVTAKAASYMASVLGQEGQGIAYVRDAQTGDLLPVATYGADTWRVYEANYVGAWASSALDVAEAFEALGPVCTATLNTGQTLTAWSIEGVLYVALAMRAHSLGKVLYRIRGAA